MDIESTQDRDRALYKILINEHFSHADVVSMLATGDSSKLDELLSRCKADTVARARDVEIITPDRMSDGIVDLNAAKIRAECDRVQKEIDEDNAHWQRAVDRLIIVMRASGESSYTLISATLNALLIVLLDDDTDLDECKKNIANSLNVFR